MLGASSTDQLKQSIESCGQWRTSEHGAPAFVPLCLCAFVPACLSVCLSACLPACPPLLSPFYRMCSFAYGQGNGASVTLRHFTVYHALVAPATRGNRLSR